MASPRSFIHWETIGAWLDTMGDRALKVAPYPEDRWFIVD